MAYSEIKGMRQIIVKLKNGDDVLLDLERELKEAGIANGVILTGVGSTISYHIHIVDSTTLPVKNIYFKDSAPFDIVNIQGHIFNGRVHAHISLGNNMDGKQFGGHLEAGCKVLTFCSMTVMEIPDIGEFDKF